MSTEPGSKTQWQSDCTYSVELTKGRGNRMGQSPSERRRMPRFDMQLPIELKLDPQLGEVVGITRDLSSAGLYFYTRPALGDLAQVELIVTFPPELTLVKSVKVRCVAKIVRQDGPTPKGFGVAAAIQKYEFITTASA